MAGESSPDWQPLSPEIEAQLKADLELREQARNTSASGDATQQVDEAIARAHQQLGGTTGWPPVPARTPRSVDRASVRRQPPRGPMPPVRVRREDNDDSTLAASATEASSLTALLVAQQDREAKREEARVAREEAREAAREHRRHVRNFVIALGAVATLGCVIAVGGGYVHNPFDRSSKNVPLADRSSSHTPSPSPDLTPSTSAAASSSASKSATASPSPTDTNLVAPHSLFAPAALGCNTNLQIKVAGMSTPVTINYTFPDTTPSASPTPAKSSKSSAAAAAKEAPKTIYQIGESAYYSGTLAVKVCANDRSIESLDPNSTKSAQVIKIDQSKYSFIFDPSQMVETSDLTSLDTKAQQKLIALFKSQGKSITATDIANISSFARTQLPALANNSLNELAAVLDTGIDGNNNGQTYQAEIQGDIQKDDTPIVLQQANSQGIPSWAISGGQPQYNNNISLVKAIAAVKAYQAAPSSNFSFNASQTAPGQITITAK